MKVKDLIKLLELQDPEADVRVITHNRSSSVYEQGGYATEDDFDPNRHLEYVDLRSNPFVKPTDPFYNKHYVLIGAMNE